MCTLLSLVVLSRGQMCMNRQALSCVFVLCVLLSLQIPGLTHTINQYALFEGIEYLLQKHFLLNVSSGRTNKLDVVACYNCNTRLRKESDIGQKRCDCVLKSDDPCTDHCCLRTCGACCSVLISTLHTGSTSLTIQIACSDRCTNPWVPASRGCSRPKRTVCVHSIQRIIDVGCVIHLHLASPCCSL